MLDKPVNIGRMDRRLRILEPVTETNETYNERINTFYRQFAVVFGERLTQPVRNLYEGDQIVALNTVRYRARFIEDVTTQMLIADGTEFFKILGIEPVDRRKFMYITCQKRDNDAAVLET
jgi:head-tail adaptor